MRGLFIAGAKSDRRDARLARPIDSVGGEVPFSAGRIWQPNLCPRVLACFHKWMIRFQCPGREVFIHWEYIAGVGRLIIKKLFELDGVFKFSRDQIFDLLSHSLLGLAEGHAAVDENHGFIWNSIDRRGLDM